jgi:hypothetical protein
VIPTLIDANVVIDVISDDARWKNWSGEALAWAARGGPVVINLIVYSEVAASFEHIDDLDDVLDEVGLGREEIPWQAAFLASRSHGLYRERGGVRSATLPDFFIGAHAAVRRWPVLTRDPRRLRTYFPSVEVIAPAEG